MTDDQIVMELNEVFKLIRPKNKFTQSDENQEGSKNEFMKSFNESKKDDHVINQKR